MRSGSSRLDISPICGYPRAISNPPSADNLTGDETMLQSLDIRHWLIIAFLILINVLVFGCLLLVLTGKVELF